VGKLYAELDDRLRKFIARQPVFFVATAPALGAGGSGGHVNLSPKGYRDTFAILGPRTVAYLDLTGSGAETIAHVRQNGRITIMFCSFSHETKVVRLYGTGEVVLPGSARWAELAPSFPRTADLAAERTSQRAIIVVELERVGDSCGYSVPEMTLTGERDVLDRWAAARTSDELADYRAEKNAVSIDGLPALISAP
jgi:Pyridoxamine 5'-phosphate oxidase